MSSQRIVYIRVSTLDQSTERQLDGIAVDKVFTDKVSGKDINRPQLQAALHHIRTGDTLVSIPWIDWPVTLKTCSDLSER